MSLLLGLGGAVASGVAGVFAKRQHNKFADYLNENDLAMPESMSSAESVYRGMASQGLPGKETIEGDIQSQIARTMGLGKQVADSPSGLLDLLSKSGESATNAIRQLGVDDANAQLKNQGMLGEFLSRAKAPMELNVDQFNYMKNVSAERERMHGTQELFRGLTQGLTTASTAFGNRSLRRMLKGDERDVNKFFRRRTRGAADGDEVYSRGNSLFGRRNRGGGGADGDLGGSVSGGIKYGPEDPSERWVPKGYDGSFLYEEKIKKEYGAKPSDLFGGGKADYRIAQYGDTLSALAQRWDTSVDALMMANPHFSGRSTTHHRGYTLSNEDLIHAGERINRMIGR
jgi:hypothetical protein